MTIVIAVASTVALMAVGVPAPIAAALGNAQSQTYALALGIQDKFHWNQVATSAISAGVTAGVSAGFTSAGVHLGQLAQAGVAAATNIAVQGVTMAVGLQDKFSWASVASSAVGSFIPNLDGPLGLAISVSARAISSAGIRSLWDGTDFDLALQQALPDVIGSTIGEMIGGAIGGALPRRHGGSHADGPVESNGARNNARRTEALERILDSEAASAGSKSKYLMDGLSFRDSDAADFGIADAQQLDIQVPAIPKAQRDEAYRRNPLKAATDDFGRVLLTERHDPVKEAQDGKSLEQIQDGLMEDFTLRDVTGPLIEHGFTILSAQSASKEIALGVRLLEQSPRLLKEAPSLIEKGRGLLAKLFSKEAPDVADDAARITQAAEDVLANWGTGPLRGPSPKVILRENETVLIDASHGLQSRTSGLFDDLVLGEHGDAASKYLYTVDERGVNIALDKTPFPTPRGNIVHTNISSKASIGGEAWFGADNSVTINAGSGRFGDGAGITPSQWHATTKLWESLGYKVNPILYGSR